MIKLPLDKNTVVTVERAIKDRYNKHMDDHIFYTKHLGAYPPDTELRSKFFVSLTRYERVNHYDRR